MFSEPDPEKQRQDIMMYCLIFVGIGAISLLAMFLQVSFFPTHIKNMKENVG